MLWLLACSGEELAEQKVEEENWVDHREEYPETDADLIFEPPALVLPPYTDQQTCWYTTYEGESVG